LPDKVSEHQLKRELDRYGSIIKVKIIREATNSKKTSLGLVYMEKKADGNKAVEYLNQA